MQVVDGSVQFTPSPACMEGKNRAADCLAKKGAANSHPTSLQIFAIPPLYAIEAFQEDSVGTIFVR